MSATAGPGGIAVAVLGAGLGSRFGGDKLAAPLRGRPLAHHLLAALDGFDWPQKLLVCRGTPGWADAYARAGFTLVRLEDARRGMLGSLHAAAARAGGDGRILVCLADMPLVKPAHLRRLLDLARDWPGAIASRAPGYRGPPSILPLPALRALPPEGEGGGRALLGDARFVDGPAAMFADVDRPEDLAGL